MAAAAPHRERRAALSSALCDSYRAEGTAWSCDRGGQLGVRERVCTRGRWAWNSLPRAVGTAPNCWSLGSVWTVLSDIGFGFWVVLCGIGSWTDDPPDQDEEADEAFQKQLDVASRSQALVRMGDFNYPDICWTTNMARHARSRWFLQCVEDSFLNQRGEGCYWTLFSPTGMDLLRK